MYATHLECARCGKHHELGKVWNLCECGGPLLVRYDLDRIGRELKKDDLRGRAHTMWRYRELLPLRDDANIVSLGEGATPELPMPRLGSQIGVPALAIKDEGKNPTGTFKARGAAMGVSMAKELGIRAIAMPTAGNAGGAWAAYAARAGIAMTVAMPQDAPELAKKETIVAGATTYLVDGLISDAGKLIASGAKRQGWFDAATLKEPYRIEGKKTMGLEIAEDGGWRQLPDVILYPCGGGVGLIGIWKALQELVAMGWISGRLPRMVAVQAEGCKPIVDAFEAGQRESQFYTGASTDAAGIRVPKALGDFLVLDAIYQSDGCAVAVSEAQIRASLAQTGRSEGLWVCPEGAAAVAAAEQLAQTGWIKPHERVLIINTGAGIKYPDFVPVDLPVVAVDAFN